MRLTPGDCVLLLLPKADQLIGLTLLTIDKFKLLGAHQTIHGQPDA